MPMRRQEKTPRPPVKQMELGLTKDGQNFVPPGAWLSDVSAALVTGGLVVCLTPTRGALVPFFLIAERAKSVKAQP
jgi:hypothetical protein